MNAKRVIRQGAALPRAVERKVQILAQLIVKGSVDPQVRDLLAKILVKNNVAPRDFAGTIRAVFRTVQKTLRFTLDPIGRDIFQTAARSIQLRLGDCDDFTILLGSLLAAAGYQPIVRIASQDGRRWTHVYLVVRFPPANPTTSIALDPSKTDAPPGWENPIFGYLRDFAVVAPPGPSTSVARERGSSTDVRDVDTAFSGWADTVFSLLKTLEIV